MRLLVFGERLAPPPDEGIKKLTVSLAVAWRHAGHDVRVLTTGGSDWAEHRIVDIPADRLLRSPELRRHIADYRPDAVIYVPTASLTLSAALRAWSLRRHAGGAPVALVAHQGRHHAAPIRLAARFVAPSVCVALSEVTALQARRLGWRTVRVAPGVDLDVFSPADALTRQALRVEHGLPLDRFIVFHAGHLNRNRGVVDLAAIADLAYPVLAASTSTPHDASLAAELERAGVRVLAHFIPDIAGLYRAADAYLFPVPPNRTAPSSIDAPLSVFEAAACGLPIIATRFGTLPDIWTGRPGVHFYSDRASLRAAVAAARSSPADTRSLAEPFGWAVAADTILQALQHPAPGTPR